MSLATEIREKINQFPEGETFGYAELRIAKNAYPSAAKVLERLQKKGEIKKVSKGVFYKPKNTLFGELQPDYNEQLHPYLFENGKRIAYVTGTSLYNSLGLTTQVAYRIKIACRGKRIRIDRGSLKASPVKSYVEVTDNNYKVLGLLDAFKDIKQIPDCSTTKAIRRLSSIIKDMASGQIRYLIKYALVYPPRVRASVGAVLENSGYENEELENLKESLNPLTTIKLGVNKNELPNKKNWYIE